MKKILVFAFILLSCGSKHAADNYMEDIRNSNFYLYDRIPHYDKSTDVLFKSIYFNEFKYSPGIESDNYKFWFNTPLNIIDYEFIDTQKSKDSDIWLMIDASEEGYYKGKIESIDTTYTAYRNRMIDTFSQSDSYQLDSATQRIKYKKNIPLEIHNYRVTTISSVGKLSLFMTKNPKDKWVVAGTYWQQ